MKYSIENVTDEEKRALDKEGITYEDSPRFGSILVKGDRKYFDMVMRVLGRK